MLRLLLAAFLLMAAMPCAACQSPSLGSPSGFRAVADAVSAAMRSHHFDPDVLRDPAYVAMEGQIAQIAASATSRDEFVKEFNSAWRNGPFSHVSIQIARSSAADTATYLDTMRVGGNGARLSWTGNVAVLTVTTMMGLDTIEQIDGAYGEIARKGARALIIDLRENDGGAFAGQSLVQHVLATPLDAGAFVSQPWARTNDRPPVRQDIADVEPWSGWSLTAFWRDVQESQITRIQFRPEGPIYSGPVYVLISKRTRSAAEMAADALLASGRATLIGERTAGRMLSQKMYDMPQDLLLSLPVADYYSFHSGRIEGAGVVPQVQVDPTMALEIALQRAIQN
jgi:C-terminal processing protease CtpA/Prc